MARSQFDWKKRVVSLENLRAMCNGISGVAHRYEIIKTSQTRVYVSYSNPDEYGNEDPVIATFPIYPNMFGGEERDNPAVVLDILSTVFDRNGYGHQHFDALIDAPVYWRDPSTGEWIEQEKPIEMEEFTL